MKKLAYEAFNDSFTAYGIPLLIKKVYMLINQQHQLLHRKQEF